MPHQKRKAVRQGGFLFCARAGLNSGPAGAGSGYAELSAACGGESEAEHWAVPQSNASGGRPRSSATRHNRVKSLMPHQREKPSERAAFCFALGRA